MILTIILLPIAKSFGLIEYPDISASVVRKVGLCLPTPPPPIVFVYVLAFACADRPPPHCFVSSAVYTHSHSQLMHMYWQVFPLPLLYLANLVTGLGGTKRINLPMFTLLRRCVHIPCACVSVSVCLYVCLSVKVTKTMMPIGLPSLHCPHLNRFRFSILMTMILEGILLGSKASTLVKFSVALMIGGALVAAT